MPMTFIATEGDFTPEAEQEIFKGLTDLLLRLHGLTGNKFMTPNVIGEVITVPRRRIFSAGQPADIAIFELKVPSFVLAAEELRSAWMKEGTDIVERAAGGKLPRDRIYANVVYAVDGLWGIGGKAYSNAELGAAISG